MNATIELILSRLDGVQSAGAGRWRSHCPAHQLPPHRAGRGRSLTLGVGDDGRVLMHCHAGCTVSDVVAAAGLNLADLFPTRAARHFSPGNGGPASWAGAAGAADALSDAAIDLVTGGGSVFEVTARAEAFKRAARAAMRADASRKEANHGGA